MNLSFTITVDGYNVVTTKDKHATVIYDITFTVKNILAQQSPVNQSSSSAPSSSSSSHNNNSHTLFSMTVNKRYSELRDLFKTLTSIISSSPSTNISGNSDFKYDFPPKLIFGNTNPENIEKRKLELQHFFDQVTMQLVLENRMEGTGGEIYKSVLQFF
eukprot:gnl/Spiro4/2428_TR1162_c0_g2_i1.p1 gnl/Spiro4/2428_TR1162_c0_g2~~gnl/Spiro4/2428_TR1162_c0_g2_i1.p1  ORF type:complete len:172 (+),score=5.16 gnl/Spiro4/2428_TR1162_c0_g2_i1:41-517(+)